MAVRLFSGESGPELLDMEWFLFLCACDNGGGAMIGDEFPSELGESIFFEEPSREEGRDGGPPSGN